MSFDIHDASSLVFVRMLGNLAAILTKAEAQAEARKIDPAVLLNARLSPDMFPLTRQIQIATDGAKGGVARLAGVEIPSFPDTETSFAELQARIEKTVAFIQGIDASSMAGSETRPISLKLRGAVLDFTGQKFLLNFVLPNFYFHITAAYMILRHNGVDIGKSDYLGSFA